MRHQRLCTGCERHDYGVEGSGPCPNCFPEADDDSLQRRADEIYEADRAADYNRDLAVEQANDPKTNWGAW